jgi:hypothetical protein
MIRKRHAQVHILCEAVIPNHLRISTRGVVGYDGQLLYVGCLTNLLTF